MSPKLYTLFMRQKKYSNQQFIDAVSSSVSVREVLTKLNLAKTGGNYKQFYVTAKNFNLDISHFKGQGYLKGKHHSYGIKIPLSEILVRGSKYQSHKLKLRLIKEGLIENKCKRCGISRWCGEVLSLHLDHIDGDHFNNQLNNIRLLCPNCHSLTETYCGKNKKKSSAGSRT